MMAAWFSGVYLPSAMSAATCEMRVTSWGLSQKPSMSVAWEMVGSETSVIGGYAMSHSGRKRRRCACSEGVNLDHTEGLKKP